MRRFLSLLTVLCVAASASTIFGGTIADSIAFQGRLTDASDVPVSDGNRDLIISIWTDSIGGTMLHSETVIITTSKGLYSTCIGCGSSTFPDIFTGQTLFLQTQLAGQAAMTPRTRLRSVPSSISSSSVNGSAVHGSAVALAIINARQAANFEPFSSMSLDADSDGDGHEDFFVKDSALIDGVHTVTGGDIDDDGIPDLACDLEVRVDRIEMRLYDDSDALQRTSVTQGASSDSANQLLGTDLDGDDIPDVVVASTVRPTTASLAIKTKGTSAQRLSAGGDCDDTDASLYTGYDDDGDGFAESSVSQNSNTDSASLSMHSISTGGMPNRISMNMTVDRQTPRGSWRLGYDGNNDGDDDCDGIFTVTPTVSSVAINTKGTGADKGRMASTTTPDSVVSEQVFEFESSLLMPALMKAKEKANRTKCSSNLRYQSPVAINDGEMAVDSTGAGLSMSTDSDGDGIPEASVKVGSGASLLGAALPGGAVLSSRCDTDDDGDAEGEFESIVMPGTCSVAIKTKGTGADKNRSAGSSADDSSAVNYLDIDDDADGISEAHAMSSVSSVAGAGGGAAAASYAATGRWYTDSDDDGVSEGDVEVFATPSTSRVAIKTKGTGAINNRAISSTTDTLRAVTVHSADLDGDGLVDRSVTQDCDDSDAGMTVAHADGEIKIRIKGWDGTIKGRMAIESGGNIEVDFGGDGVGFVSQRFGIGVLSPTNPFEHSSGAHLTAGGVWTNASDVNLKENFQQVDGAELLEKIEQLPISEWNYKNESDDIKHIGPTAQDFQATFGVGSDGKSISTIDPSGIALAAIKQLKKENTELKKQVEELSALKAEIELLKKMIVEKK